MDRHCSLEWCENFAARNRSIQHGQSIRQPTVEHCSENCFFQSTMMLVTVKIKDCEQLTMFSESLAQILSNLVHPRIVDACLVEAWNRFSFNVSRAEWTETYIALTRLPRIDDEVELDCRGSWKSSLSSGDRSISKESWLKHVSNSATRSAARPESCSRAEKNRTTLFTGPNSISLLSQQRQAYWTPALYINSL